MERSRLSLLRPPAGDSPSEDDGPSAVALEQTWRQLLLSGRGWAWLRFSADVLAMLAAVVAALVGAPEGIAREGGTLVWALPPLMLACMAAWGLYGATLKTRVLDGLGLIAAASSLAAIALIAAEALVAPASTSAPLIARAWLFAMLYVSGGRMLLTATQLHARGAGLVGEPTLIIGAGQIGARVERHLTSRPELGLRPIGYIDADPPSAEMVSGRNVPVLGAPAELIRIAADRGVEHVILAFSSAPDSMLLPIMRECEANGLQISMVPRMFDSLTKRVRFESIGALPLVGMRWTDPQSLEFTMKHVLDRLLSVLLLIGLSPLMLFLATAVGLTSPGPVVFRQRRVGRDGRVFDMYKFRSMRMADPAEARWSSEGEADLAPGGVEGPDRRTGLGKFIRRHSLDELPQLMNVLKGDMSLVGPRPERPEYAELFGETVGRYEDRHRVRSGITGLAQVNGLRGKTSLADRTQWDNYYIQNWSLGLDLKILFLTVWVVSTMDAE